MGYASAYCGYSSGSLRSEGSGHLSHVRCSGLNVPLCPGMPPCSGYFKWLITPSWVWPSVISVLTGL